MNNMDDVTLGEALIENSAQIAEALGKYLDRADKNAEWYEAVRAMRYSLIAGGKAVRPFLVRSFCALFGGDDKKAVPLACAIEMMHASSLIHDDLPAMDNDDMRRGRPSCHKAFGEYTAILAGDALMLASFDIAVEAGTDIAYDAVKTIASCAGVSGMIGGQQLDLEFQSKAVSESDLTEMCRLKTGKLIEASCLLGVLTAKSTMTEEEYAESCHAASKYAFGVGLAFQICDDILDVTGDQKLLGKNIGSDAENGKPTFASLLGIDAAYALAETYTKDAIKAVEKYNGSEMLSQFARSLLKRKK